MMGKEKALADALKEQVILLWESSYSTAHPVKFIGPLQLSSNTDNCPLSSLSLAAMTALYW